MSFTAKAPGCRDRALELNLTSHKKPKNSAKGQAIFTSDIHLHRVYFKLVKGNEKLCCIIAKNVAEDTADVKPRVSVTGEELKKRV